MQFGDLAVQFTVSRAFRVRIVSPRNVGIQPQPEGDRKGTGARKAVHLRAWQITRRVFLAVRRYALTEGIAMVATRFCSAAEAPTVALVSAMASV
jgi:hypothetical protein